MVNGRGTSSRPTARQFLVEYWQDNTSTKRPHDWRWALDSAHGTFDAARESLRRLAAEGHKARITQLLETAEPGDEVR